MTLQWLLGWWNLVFLVPFVIALTYLGLYAATGITFGDGADAGVDADVDGDVGADADADVHGDAHADVDADVHADLHADADHSGEHSSHHSVGGRSGGASASLLGVFGVGRVPLSLLAMIFLLTWSISGFGAVQWLHQTMESGERIALYALPFAAFVSMLLTAGISRALGSLFPMNEAPAMSLPQLVGQHGVAVLPITESFGLASVRLDGGASMQVPCRVADGEPTIASHSTLVLLRLDRAARLFYVTTPDRLETLRGEQPRTVTTARIS